MSEEIKEKIDKSKENHRYNITSSREWFENLLDYITNLQQENKQLKEALLDIKELQDNYLEEIYKGNVNLRLASSTLCKIDNIVNKALGDKENDTKRNC